jgi:hypothetical protein
MAKRSGKVLGTEAGLAAERMSEMEKLAAGSQEESEDAPKKLKLSSLKDLIFLGKLTKKELINGFLFEVSTLSISEQKLIMKNIMKSEEVDRLLDIKPLTMSYALRTINGVPLEDLSDNEDLPVEQRRLNVVLNMQISLVERLHRIHEELVAESSKEVGLEELKK